jgi:hypothetical protein
MTRSDLEAATEYLGEYNPHKFDQHYATWQCTDCHKGHSQSVNMCTDCHAQAPVPDGWLNVEQRRQIEANAFGGEAQSASRTAAEEDAAHAFKDATSSQVTEKAA